jgi:hypothetical protein
MLLGRFRVCLGPTESLLGPVRPFLGASALPGQVKLVLGKEAAIHGQQWSSLTGLTWQEY